MSSIMKPVLGSQVQIGHPLAYGLVGYWLLNEGTGNKVFDLSGNGNTGTLSGGTYWTGGKFGLALGFDGWNDFVKYGDILGFQQTDSFSISVWFNRTGDSLRDLHLGTIIGKGAVGGSNSGYSLFVSDPDDKLYFQVRQAADDSLYQTSGYLITDGIWYHAVVVRDTATKSIHLYVNGIWIETVSEATLIDISTTYNFMMGGTETSVGIFERDFYGLIDISMIFNRALSASEIAQLYREPFCMFERDPIELWSAATLGAAPPVGMAGAMTTNTGYWGW